MPSKNTFIHLNLQERAKEEEREPSLFKVYFATYWVRMLAGAILKFITDMGAYVGPLAIGGITLYVTDAVYGEHEVRQIFFIYKGFIEIKENHIKTKSQRLTPVLGTINLNTLARSFFLSMKIIPGSSQHIIHGPNIIPVLIIKREKNSLGPVTRLSIYPPISRCVCRYGGGTDPMSNSEEREREGEG